MNVEVNWTAVALFAAGQLIASIIAGVGLYVAIRVDMARVNERVALGLEALKASDSLILERADDAHSRIDRIYERLTRSTKS